MCAFSFFSIQLQLLNYSLSINLKPLSAVRVVHCAELSLTLSDFCMGDAYPGVSAVRDCRYLSGEGSWRSPLVNGRELWKLR